MTSIMMLVYFLISLTVMILSSNLAKINMNTMEKNSPFECGFNPLLKTRIPFSLQFFLIALIFIIFDIEIILIMPIPLINTKNIMMMSSTLTIMIILTVGLFHEWNEGSLNWF